MKFNINQRNKFDEKSQKFFQSKLKQRLAKKYQEKPFEERYNLVYIVANLVSYLCNGVSIITASSFVFSYVFSIVSAVPYPLVVAGAVSGMVLVTIEILQRTLAPKMLQNHFQYGERGLVVPILFLSIASVVLSYSGSPDFISIIKTAPVYKTPDLEDVDAIKKDFVAQIDQARSEAENFKTARIWHGRLRESDGRTYNGLLSKVSELREQKTVEVNNAIARNEKAKSKAENDYKTQTETYDNKVASRGSGLGLISIFAQLIFFLCIGFTEYHDYRVITQYIGEVDVEENDGSEEDDDGLSFSENGVSNGVKKKA